MAVFMFMDRKKETFGIRRKLWRKCTAITLVFFLALPLAGAKETVKGEQAAVSDDDFYSRACALLDGYSGRLLYGKKAQDPMANASTTKILTCIVALENGDTSAKIEASKRAAGQPKVRLGMKVGSAYCVKDLLYCLMLESYNDCAVAIAESVAGTVEDFAVLMNQKAEEIGCEDSYFITPNGLDDKNENGFHHTTAQDLCRIMRYCVWESPSREQFLEITRTSAYQFTDEDGISHSASNHNQLLTSMDGALSGKTGFTADAGYCYVMAYEKDGKRFCAAFLACGWPNNKNYKWKDAKKMIAYANEHFEKCNLYQEPQIPSLVLEGCHGENAGLGDWKSSLTIQPYMKDSAEELYYMLADDDKVDYCVRFEKGVKSPIHESDAVGAYEIRLNDTMVRQYALLAGNYADTWDFYQFARLIFTSFLPGA